MKNVLPLSLGLLVAMASTASAYATAPTETSELTIINQAGLMHLHRELRLRLGNAEKKACFFLSIALALH